MSESSVTQKDFIVGEFITRDIFLACKPLIGEKRKKGTGEKDKLDMNQEAC